MKYLSMAMIALVLMGSGVLNAQDIVVEYPTGTPQTNGTTVNLGKSDNGDVHNITVTVGNADAMATLDLATGYVDGSGYKNVSVNFTSPSPPISLDDMTTIDITVDIDPSKDSDWSFNLIINSNDAQGDDPFILKFKGTQGSPDDDDDDCSTGEGSTFSWLMLLAAISGLAVATRLRGSRA